MTRFVCCGVLIDGMGSRAAVGEIIRRAAAAEPAAVHLCNAYTLSLAQRNQVFRSTINQGDINLPDGAPVAWLGHRFGGAASPRRVYGPDLMFDVIAAGLDQGLRHYLYGSTEAVLERLTGELRRRFERIIIVGTEAPPFRPLAPSEEDEIGRRLVAAEPNVVWVGLGTPKQDEFVARMRGRVPAPLVAVGAAFDFHAGLKRQAPHWMRSWGLEWLFRLVTEPRRLWRRYLIGNCIFILGVFRGGVHAVDHH